MKVKVYKMNILIIGSGGVGIALGASMISQGVNVSFFARGKTAKYIKENGIKRTGIFEHLSYLPDEYEVFTDYKDIPENTFDFVFICSKTTANENISDSLNEYKTILKDGASIIIFQNGFGNDEPYLRYFNDEQVFCARVITGFERCEPNISEVTVHTEPILIGSLQGADTKRVEEIPKLISASGIPSEITDDVAKYLWAKMLYNCALNPLGAILGVNYGELTENEYSVANMNKIIEEIFEVIHAGGYKTNWETAEEYEEVFYSKLVPDTYNHFSSTYQDIQKKQKTEIDSLNGTVIYLGEKFGVEKPQNKFINN